MVEQSTSQHDYLEFEKDKSIRSEIKDGKFAFYF